MVSIFKTVGLMSWRFLLCLGQSHTAQAVDAAQAGHPASQSDPLERKGGQVGVYAAGEKLKVGHRIEGDLLRVEGKDYFVMGKDWSGNPFT